MKSLKTRNILKVVIFNLALITLVCQPQLQAIYEILLGASQGPRFGGFIALYGVNETIELINQGLNGELIG